MLTSKKHGWPLATKMVAATWLLVALGLLSACGPSGGAPAETPAAAVNVPVVVDGATTGATTGDVTAVTQESTTGYPGMPAAAPAPAYPVPTLDGMQAEPPSPEVNLPAASGNNGVVGGVLIREVSDQGFIPLVPKELILGEIVSVNTGEPAYVRTNEASPRAELFPTGVFIFRNVPPGEYGLVMDLGFSQFLIEEYTFSVEPGQVLDLGQVITKTPE